MRLLEGPCIQEGLGEKAREARLRWFGRVQRRDSGYIGRRMLEMELPGRKQRSRLKRRYMNAVKEDMQVVGVRIEDTENRLKWKTESLWQPLKRDKLEKKMPSKIFCQADC